MLGTDARQLRAAPDFQTQADRNCLATQQGDSEGAEGTGYRQSHVLLQKQKKAAARNPRNPLTPKSYIPSQLTHRPPPAPTAYRSI